MTMLLLLTLLPWILLGGEQVSSQLPDICLKKPDTGSVCDGASVRFFYDSATSSCKCVQVNRCEENGFSNLTACLSECASDNACLLPKRKPKTCKGQRTYWFYDTTSGSCQTFRAGPKCKRNANRFTSEADCKEKCPPLCPIELPMCSDGKSPEMTDGLTAKYCRIDGGSSVCSANYSCTKAQSGGYSVCCPVLFTVTCPPREEYVHLRSRCAENCSALVLVQKNLTCTDPPENGCFCQEGFHRSPNGSCVPSNTCVCAINEEYRPCYNRCAEASCNPERVQQDQCSDCQAGCFCVEGTARVRDPAEHLCVPTDLCAEQRLCSYPEEWMCGNRCAESCSAVVDPESLLCPPGCAFGCYCPEGLHRDTEGVCVDTSTCRYKCAATEIYNECGNRCRESCEYMPGETECPATCGTGCFCVEGYSRTAGNQCVLSSECPAAGTQSLSTDKITSAITTTVPCVASPNRGYACKRRKKQGRYWYNKCTNTCQRFVYKGCGGNSLNNYHTNAECENDRGIVP